MNILLVENKLNLAEFIIQELEEQNYYVDFAREGVTGKRLALNKKYDLIILDTVLPGVSGLEIYKSIRRLKMNIPVLILTNRSTEQLRVLGYMSGADDYLVKPFHIEDLLARIKMISRQPLLEDNNRSAHLEINRQNRTVIRSGIEIALTNTELALLKCFLAHRNQVLSHAEIAREVWGPDFDNSTNRVGVYVKYLRDKIDKGFTPHFIYTVVGMGYMLRDD
jgi:DNA-binding response OmpR family regulator